MLTGEAWVHKGVRWGLESSVIRLEGWKNLSRRFGLGVFKGLGDSGLGFRV